VGVKTPSEAKKSVYDRQINIINNIAIITNAAIIVVL